MCGNPDCQTCSWCCMVIGKVIYYCSNLLLCVFSKQTHTHKHTYTWAPKWWAQQRFRQPLHEWFVLHKCTIYTNSCIFSSTGRWVLLGTHKLLYCLSDKSNHFIFHVPGLKIVGISWLTKTLNEPKEVSIYCNVVHYRYSVPSWMPHNEWG